jgi:glycosyltransferase involved in cell wall biosynthesis
VKSQSTYYKYFQLVRNSSIGSFEALSFFEKPSLSITHFINSLGFGLSIVEGMATKRPVVASDVDGLREIVRGYGVLFPHQDSESLANEIKLLCENQEKYNQIASTCQKRAKQFDINIMAKKYNQLYQQCYK